MHIEPGLVEGPKIILSYVTATGAGPYALTLAWKLIRDRGPVALPDGVGIDNSIIRGPLASQRCMRASS
jgi:hypothetical protein